MYGTVARMILKPDAYEKFMALGREVETQGIPGWIGEYVYRSDSDPNELFMAVVFESKEAYRKHAESPASAAMYERMRALLAADPEWHDGAVVYVKPQGS